MNNSSQSNSWLLFSVTGLILASGSLLSPAVNAQEFTLNFDQGADGGSLLRNSDGTLDATQWSSWGLSQVGGINNRTGQAAKLNTYNTAAGGQDNDLRTGNTWGTTNQGNVLIIQEQDGKNNRYLRNNSEWRADDEARGGNITFDFDSEVTLNSFSLLDIDDNGDGIGVAGYDADGNQVIDIDIDTLINSHIATNGADAAAAQGKSVTVGQITMTQLGNKRGDNSLYEFAFANTQVASLNFVYPGSGAIAGLEWSKVDEHKPRAVPEPSAVGGLLVLGTLAARKLRQRK